MVFSYLIDGFAYSAESLVGKSIGARNPVQLKKVVRLLFLWGLAISIIFTLTYLVAGDKLLLILTDNTNVIEQTKPYLFWIVFIPIITFTAFLWDGIYIGALASKGMRNSMLISTILVFLPLYFLLHPLLENNGLWLALNAFMITRGITLTIMAKKEIFSRI
jgi:MATE family multidrug resistance protein